MLYVFLVCRMSCTAHTTPQVPFRNSWCNPLSVTCILIYVDYMILASISIYIYDINACDI